MLIHNPILDRCHHINKDVILIITRRNGLKKLILNLVERVTFISFRKRSSITMYRSRIYTDPLHYANKIHEGVNATYSHYSDCVQEPKSMALQAIMENNVVKY